MKSLFLFGSLLMLSSLSWAQDRGRIYLDHMSIAVPENWELHIFSSDITLTSPVQIDTSYKRCSITISVAIKFSGDPVELLSAVDKHIPGDLVKQHALPVRKLPNGWNASESLYRNRYVKDIFTRAIAITKNEMGQVVTVSNNLSSCSGSIESVIRTLRVADTPMRLRASGAPLKLLPPAKSEGVDPGSNRTGTTCMAGGITCLNSGPVGSSCMCASTTGPQLGTVF